MCSGASAFTRSKGSGCISSSRSRGTIRRSWDSRSFRSLPPCAVSAASPFKDLDVMTKAFVVGHPIKHSRSPLIHGHWLKTYGIEGSYERIDVEPVNFGSFLQGFHAQGFAGGNVTLPHKEAAFAGVARRTGRAERLRAVNTLWVENGVLWGDNTDVLGFMANLDGSLGAGWEQAVETALVLGA